MKRKAVIAAPLTAEQKLEAKLIHAIKMETRAASRVRRAATLLHKWQLTKRRIEKRIGDQEVRRIINRLSTN